MASTRGLRYDKGMMLTTIPLWGAKRVSRGRHTQDKWAYPSHLEGYTKNMIMKTTISLKGVVGEVLKGINMLMVSMLHQHK